MIIAQQKRKENIIEYILYMWHIEDLIRANDFDMDKIRKHVISRFEQPSEVIRQMEDWYQKLIGQMENEEIRKGGHLSDLVELTHQLNDFHLNLINDLNEPQYNQAYHLAQPYIAELKKKSNPGTTEIEVCLNALYMLMMMRINKTVPSDETTAAVSTFSNMLSLLNLKYRQRK
ncbi:MAG: DUF4924 family protein [Bacteroidales bacterium]|jgi:hypothetical protein|nr:DUF4924 family protein [Bacteroidales bacterium]